MNIYRLILTVVLLKALSCSAQEAQADAGKRAGFRVVFNFDFRRTHVNGDPVKFYGFRLGAQKGRDILAIGFHGLGDPYVEPMVDLAGQGMHELITEFDYVTLAYERLLIDSKRWQIGVPVSVGLGNYRRSLRDGEGGLVPYSTNELVPIELSCHADYNVFWWVFIGVGGGYRHVLAADQDATRALSNWTYYGKLGFRFGEVIKRIGKRKKEDHGS